MIASICTRLSKLPVCSGIARTFYKALHKTMCKKISLNTEEANKLLEGVYTKPSGTVAWQRNAEVPSLDLSVIIPFYKTEQYAMRCIESILTQQVSCSMEVILVDDGSPDRCGEILDSYADRENVVVVHQKNSGLSASRNNALAIARGEYVLFLDSDDYLVPNSLQVLMEHAKKYDADIVEGGVFTFNDADVRKNYLHQFEVSTKGRNMFGYACGKLIRASLFDNVQFPVGFWYEDSIIHSLVTPMANTTVCIPDLIYAYYKNSSGITAQTKVSPKCIDTLTIFETILDYYVMSDKMIPPQLMTGMIRQLGDFLCFRTKGLKGNLQVAVFALAADMVDRYDLCPAQSAGYYEKEIYLALKNRQYKRWKWASILV